jgi:hypothetical protein
MPIRYQDLQPGDILLCYGWNKVGVAQGIVKAGRTILHATNVPLMAISLMDGPAATGGSGAADCNHALVIGTRKMEIERSESIVVDLRDAVAGEKPRFTKVGDRTLLQSNKAPDSDISALVAAHEGSLRKVSVDLKRNKIVAGFHRQFKENIPRVCHSTGGGCTWTIAHEYFETHAGKLALFRMRPDATSARLVTRASEVASRWAKQFTGASDAPSQYSTRKATMSAFGSHHYGSGAGQRAAKFRAARDADGGPRSDAYFFGSKTGYKEWFCSMFVIACYLAATDNDDEALAYMPLDARYTTPMKLDGFLRASSKWQLIATT